MKEAMFYEKLSKGRVRCHLCAHRCGIAPGARGICGVRENQDGTLVSLVYEKAVACSVDPIEKKPFFHFLPGSRALSIATARCNFRCSFCQNYHISDLGSCGGRIEGRHLPCEDVVRCGTAFVPAVKPRTAYCFVPVRSPAPWDPPRSRSSVSFVYPGRIRPP